MSRVPHVDNRKELKSVLTSIVNNTDNKGEFDFKNKLKTYVIESNISDINSQSLNGQFKVINTSDKSLKILKTAFNGKSPLSFYLDVSDSRFWKLHSLYDSKITEDMIRKIVESNNSKLDYLWLSSNLLEKYMKLGKNNGFGVKFKNQFSNEENEEEIKNISMRFWGGGAKDVIDDLKLNPRLVKGISISSIGIKHSVEGGYSNENIASFGRFTMMKGDSIDSHFNLIEKIKTDYSDKLNLLELSRFSVEKNKVGLKCTGNPLYIDFDKSQENLGILVDKMVSSTKPFRLSGIKQKENDSFYRVFGIDLHTNHLVNLEITPDWIAIYLSHNSCGNVVTRLLSNIQSHLTSQVKLVGEDNERII